MNYDVQLICGGDFDRKAVWSRGRESRAAVAGGCQNVNLLEPLRNSISERRDIAHDRAIYTVLAESVTRLRPSLIWERSFRLHCAGLEIAQKLGIPYVLEWKDHLIPYALSWHHKRAVSLEARKTREADFIVVESCKLRENLGGEGVDPQKILVAHNAVDCEEFGLDKTARKEIREEMGIRDEEVLVGYLGTYAFYHDARRLILAADILRQKAKKVKILMMGEGGEWAECQGLAQRLGVRDPYLLTRPGVATRQVPRILSALDIAVLPGSTDIICPIKVQEYMASGLPAVVPDYACNREVIRDGETGVLFKPKDECSLAERIFVLANDRGMRERIGLRAREEAVGRFSWEVTWGAALDTVLERLRLKPIGHTVGNAC